MQKMRSKNLEGTAEISTVVKNKGKDQNIRRMLKARREIERYFEEKDINDLSDKEYWEAL